MKEKLISTLGGFGTALWYIFCLILAVMPIAAIGMPFWVDLILVAIITFVPVTSGIFWIWGLICTIRGPQDVIAIVYYVLFVILFLPTFISIVTSFIRSIFKRN